ncbi:hypothetical protein [Sphingomonas sp. PB4P5]|uniref:hypothetical protein n=1 Tax=Parasphingomonas puruogangriensis TaxID=3096155 RepID=UPI002FC69C0A
MNTALNLMVDQGDTLLVAAIAHPLHLAENHISIDHDAIIAASIRSQGGGHGSLSPE